MSINTCSLSLPAWLVDCLLNLPSPLSVSRAECDLPQDICCTLDVDAVVWMSTEAGHNATSGMMEGSKTEHKTFYLVSVSLLVAVIKVTSLLGFPFLSIPFCSSNSFHCYCFFPPNPYSSVSFFHPSHIHFLPIFFLTSHSVHSFHSYILLSF